jgi:hypothetical protein
MFLFSEQTGIIYFTKKNNNQCPGPITIRTPIIVMEAGNR